VPTFSETTFSSLVTPAGDRFVVPSDITIWFPEAPEIAVQDRHYLAYIPWNDAFVAHVPLAYRRFFYYVLPYLHSRTSDVHTALSVGQLPHLLQGVPQPFNSRVVYLALILHDCGWSQVSTQGLVDSLSYSGVSPSSSASLKPKRQHLIYGEALAYKLLDKYDFGAGGPDDDQQYYISEIIRRHDNDAPWEQDKYGPISRDVQIVCDADRLWSFTHENFGLDTVRKGVDPEQYVDTINGEIATYFSTEQGKARARYLLAERRHEVAAYAALGGRMGGGRF
jgi:hypothetical protein